MIRVTKAWGMIEITVANMWDTTMHREHWEIVQSAWFYLARQRGGAKHPKEYWDGIWSGWYI